MSIREKYNDYQNPDVVVQDAKRMAHNNKLRGDQEDVAALIENERIFEQERLIHRALGSKNDRLVKLGIIAMLEDFADQNFDGPYHYQVRSTYKEEEMKLRDERRERCRNRPAFCEDWYIEPVFPHRDPISRQWQNADEVHIIIARQIFNRSGLNFYMTRTEQVDLNYNGSNLFIAGEEVEYNEILPDQSLNTNENDLIETAFARALVSPRIQIPEITITCSLISNTISYGPQFK